MLATVVEKKVIALGIVLLAMTSGVVWSDYTTGFETTDNSGYVAGQTVDGVDGWIAKLNSAYTVTSDDLPYAGTQSLRVGEASGGGATVSRSVSLGTTGGLCPKLDVYLAVNDQAAQEGLLYMGSGASISSSNAAVQVWFERASGNLLYRNGATTATIGAYTASEYYHVVAVLDMENHTYDMSITGEGINFSVEDAAFRKNMETIDWLCINSYASTSTNGGYIFVDNLSITPEPTTLALLAFGGVAGLLRRKRNHG